MSELTVDEEAARWFLRLQDPAATLETFLEWQRWLSRAPEHRIAFEALEASLTLLDRVKVTPPLPSMREVEASTYDGSIPVSEYLAIVKPPLPSVRSKDNRGGAIRRRRLSLAVAAAAVVAVLAVEWIGFGVLRESSRGPFAYSTAPGERRYFTLPDGSNVTLDADSALNVQLVRGRRLLRLARGEAYFKVAKDPARPFIVSAGGTNVRALGTEFDVRMADRRTVIAVVEGTVQVAAPTPGTPVPISTESGPSLGLSPHLGDADLHRGLVARVGAGQAVAYAEDKGLEKLPPAEASVATAWLGGRRQYHNEPLKDVLADVNRYASRRIEVADEATGALQFTGTLDVDNSDAWLKALAIALPVTVTQNADGGLVVSYRTSAAEPPSH